ncbi:unnamed protein product [Phytophthora fragariaefolia]|uniref:Unnamed protein product n=1 Tax=Phytophthora fragariaefolia TaxID=1490495 RepID=A0A9W6YER4_9STRA|nr:unnamed protein product [Phytophthora fragariaefolia]
MLVVGVYVDDLLVTGTQQEAVDEFFSELTELSIKDLGPASKFLGIRVNYSEEEGYDLDQDIAILDMLKEHGMEFAHSVRTPTGVECNERHEAGDEKLPVSGGGNVVTVRRFQSLIGSLMWVARFVAYSDADFAADKEDRKSVTGGLVTMDGMPVSWTCKKQGGVSLSTMEAEYTAASVMATELLGVLELLGELNVKHVVPMTLRVDNQAALKQLEGEGASEKAKHIDVRTKFVGDYTKRGVLKPEYREGENMPADLMTKAVEAPRLNTLRRIVGLH